MANPSVKDGFMPLANELLEHFAKVNIPGNEMRIIWVVFRKTWGWIDQGDRRKEWDHISLSQMVLATGMKRSTVVRCLKSLVAKRLLLKEGIRVKFNQNYDDWILTKRPACSSQKATSNSSQLATKSSSQKATYKRKKESKERNTVRKYANAPKKPRKRKSDRYGDMTPLTRDEFVKKMRESPLRRLNIMAEYADEIKTQKHTKGQWYEFVDRNISAATKLSGYTDEQIAKAMEKIKANIKSISNPKGYITSWTLETVLKNID